MDPIKIALAPLARILRFKMEYTQTVHVAMMEQFPELKGGKPDITWPEMWSYLDRLNFPDKLSCPSMSKNFMPSHLFNSLKEKSYHLPSDDHWEQYGLMKPA